MTDVLVFKLPTSTQLCSHGSPRPLEDVPDGLCHSLSVDLSNTGWAQKRLINKLSGNSLGTVTRIRRIIIITFGTSVVMHNGITFGAGIGVGVNDHDIVTEAPYQTLALQKVTYPRTLHHIWYWTKRYRYN